MMTYEEEGEYENAAYHHGAENHGAENGKTEEAHVEEGVLYQPLTSEEAGEAGSGASVRLCQDSPRKASKMESCAQYASIFGKAWHWVTHHIHKLVAAGVGAVSTLAVGAATLLATTGCAASAAVSADPFEAFDCYKIGIMGTTLTFAVAASTFEAWNDTKN